jgi:integrase
MFIELVGDKRVDLYKHDDFQKFVDIFQYWPPDPNKYKELKGKKILEILALNEENDHRFGVLGKNTLEGHYLVDTRTILNQAVFDAGIVHPIPKFKLTLSKIFVEPKRRQTPKMSGMTEAFRIGIDSGKLDNAMLNLLGMTTFRRINPLVYLRGNHLTRVGDIVIAKIPQHITDPITGRLTPVKIKTSESLTGFVLNKILDDIGFCTFAMSLGDKYLFPGRHTCDDPGDAAQKLVNGILARSGAGGTFHGFRGWGITRMREAGVSDYASRLQAGHAPLDEHENYGELPFSAEDAAKIRNLTMPSEVNFDLFKNLDFARLWRNSST